MDKDKSDRATQWLLAGAANAGHVGMGSTLLMLGLAWAGMCGASGQPQMEVFGLGVAGLGGVVFAIGRPRRMVIGAVLLPFATIIVGAAVLLMLGIPAQRKADLSPVGKDDYGLVDWSSAPTLTPQKRAPQKLAPLPNSGKPDPEEAAMRATLARRGVPIRSATRNPDGTWRLVIGALPAPAQSAPPGGASAPDTVPAAPAAQSNNPAEMMDRAMDAQALEESRRRNGLEARHRAELLWQQQKLNAYPSPQELNDAALKASPGKKGIPVATAVRNPDGTWRIVMGPPPAHAIVGQPPDPVRGRAHIFGELPPETQVHFIGIHEAAADLQKPMPINRTGNRYGEINIDVSLHAPVVLVLSSFEPVHWIVHAAAGAQIKGIILSGYFQQTEETYPPTVGVTDMHVFYQPSQYFYPDGPDSPDLGRAEDQIAWMTGLPTENIHRHLEYAGFNMNLGEQNDTTVTAPPEPADAPQEAPPADTTIVPFTGRVPDKFHGTPVPETTTDGVVE